MAAARHGRDDLLILQMSKVKGSVKESLLVTFKVVNLVVGARPSAGLGV